MSGSHHTKAKGDLGVLKAQVEVFQIGTGKIWLVGNLEGKNTQE